MAKRKPTPGVVLEKTVIIWDELNADVVFFLVEGDHSHLNRVYINTYYDDVVAGTISKQAFEARMDELNSLIYEEDGKYRQVELTEFPLDAVLTGARVIVAGFLP
jgi:hypothetical protein